MRAALRTFGLTLVVSVAFLSATATAAEMAFRTASHGGTSGDSWIVAEGEIVRSTPSRFREFLKREGISRGARYEVYLHSPGGNLIASIELGKMIRDYGFGTRVARSVPLPWSRPSLIFEIDEEGRCFSACAFAFLGGHWRIANARSLGVHQHYTADALMDVGAKKFSALDLSAQQKVAGMLAEYIAQMGVDGRFLTRAASAGPNEIYLFDAVEMAEYAITWNDAEYSDWRIEPYESGVIAVSERRNKTDVVALYCTEPEALMLLLVTRLRFPGAAEDGENLIPRGGIFVFDSEIPRTDVSGKATPDRWEFRIRLPRDIDPDKGRGISANGPMRFLFYQDIPSARFRDMTRVVSRNCISKAPTL